MRFPLLSFLVACGSSNAPATSGDGESVPDAGRDAATPPDASLPVDAGEDAARPPADPACPALEPFERSAAGDPFRVGASPMQGWDPFVLREEDGTYRVWYTLYVPPTLGIAYAESPDGTTWTVHDPPHVLRPTAGGWDQKLETVSVLKKDGVYYLWYLGYPCGFVGNGRHKCIGHATSADGITWEKHGEPVLEGTDAWDTAFASHLPNGETATDGGVQEPSVLWDEALGLFRMWYEGYGLAAYPGGGVAAAHQIGYAWSEDGIVWTKHGDPVFQPATLAGADVPWEDGSFVGHTNVLADPGSGLHLFYSTRWGIGHAFSLDGIAWERDASNPIVGPVFDRELWMCPDPLGERRSCAEPFPEFTAFGGPAAVRVDDRVELFLMRSPPTAICWGQCVDESGACAGCGMTLGLAIGTCGG